MLSCICILFFKFSIFLIFIVCIFISIRVCIYICILQLWRVHSSPLAICQYPLRTPLLSCICIYICICISFLICICICICILQLWQVHSSPLVICQYPPQDTRETGTHIGLLSVYIGIIITIISLNVRFM